MEWTFMIFQYNKIKNNLIFIFHFINKFINLRI